MPERHDTVIVGAGQAGLVMSYHLRARGREHILLERSRIGERWRTERWDSLRFQLPNEWLALPGKPYAGTDPGGFSHYTDVVRLIEEYASEIDAPVRTGVEVRSVKPGEGRGYTLETSEGTIAADHVVLATGPFQRPLVPAFARDIPSFVHQTDAAQYRNPSLLPDGAVLVVGSGNSGCQIAEELLRSGRRVFLAVSRHTRVPRRYRGKDVIWWYDRLGRFDVPIDTFSGRRYPATTLMTGADGGHDISPVSLAGEGARLAGRVLGVEDGTLGLAPDTEELLRAAERGHDAFLEAADAYSDAEGGEAEFPRTERPAERRAPAAEPLPSLDLAKEGVRSIVWSNGYGFALDWVKLPVFDEAGTPVQRRGVTASPGLYFLGIHWMHTFRSAILTFVERDAAYIADHMDHLSGRA